MRPKERRGYARHPIRVPLAVMPRSGGSEHRATVGDISETGLSFSCPSEIQPGSVLEMSLPVGDQPFTLVGSVARCERSGEVEDYRIGVEFLHPGMSFRMKLAEQVLRIQELRRELSRERGNDVSSEEAARQWVERYAAEFADLYSGYSALDE